MLGAVFILYAIFMGHFNSGLRSLKNTYFRAFGKFCFLAAITSPVIINLLYCGAEEEIYLSNPTATNLGAGNIICICLAVFPMYLIIDFPINRLVHVLLTSRILHTDLLKKAHQLELKRLEEERKGLDPPAKPQQFTYIPPMN